MVLVSAASPWGKIVSESKTSNVLERSSGKNKEVIIAVPKTSNVLERLNVS